MIIDGVKISETKMERLKNEIEKIKNTGINPKMKIILIGNDYGSVVYSKAKMRRGSKLGIDVDLDRYDSISREDLIKLLKRYSQSDDIHGIMIETPVPGINYYDVVNEIPFYKDVDGMTSYNLGNLYLKNEFIAPATARAVVDILDYINIKSGNVAIINRSPVVGRPLSMMLLNRDFTVTVCHSRTVNINEITRSSDIVVVAVGKPNFLDRSYVSDKNIIIDVGINYLNGKTCGDADYENIKDYVNAITPVPGGVGPVTATDIFENFINGLKYQIKG
ncbi:bifunctional methylenetetrahydrofolate dehydrogenase/methenyltetrahydrofolate cyclohydrolase FolD [Picrophilus oshimae]|uniref:Bifunctional protein FolD n=1 Tax=Picrophilus torridus (strain ATCC 700027 / DSM 9790 / JCM 10055 / NBRC 100828 / KAW 2/3) TaxID=1122961 RepID=FOLD_PICTO|nr:bifunctional methylenetetrahydrofolate dehydrogenase/methenyltetrahydrofolate cyclohydrolase FolD [Picrophilus oshimae]Q6L046.1 RecName: Full=Bifunctional protein FolD; Includes: RecName: Full=Methylenetetrahydrofolate dehydrogenase; Includes: RecName: Full=Methenyltetrahydrofolate cyclohydrolase [Picrophilus oshimae DSM 9789]AAT43656.1 methylenetetrahydrofolate dehydrogenase/methenyltetrahydrofolate cyclohydrolase [Picrophilus oshimae DSM 9789]